MNFTPFEKRKSNEEKENKSNKKQKTNQYEDAVALLQGLGKSIKLTSPDTNEQTTKFPFKPDYITPFTVPPSFNMPHVDNTYQPYNISARHYPFVNELSGGMVYPGLSYVGTPYPSIPYPYGYSFSPILPFSQVVQPIQPVSESSKQMIHPGQISIGPDSLLYQTLSESSLRKDNSKRNKFFL